MGVELDKEAKEKYRKLSTSELAKRLSESSHRLEAGAEYSDDEIRQVQTQLGRRHNAHTPELARLNLFVNDLIERQASGEVLEERKKEG